MFNLKQRSSMASSVVTAVTGWVGMVVMFHLLLQQQLPVFPVIPVTLVCAFLQLLFLKLFFFKLSLNKKVSNGIPWGALSSLALLLICLKTQTFAAGHWVWMPVFIATGVGVGGYLSYFYIDDQRIQFAQSFRSHVNYGRDGRWLLPVLYGDGGYLLAFLPALSLQVIISAIVTGSMVGIIAAGYSHYTNDRWKFNALALTVLAAVPGIGIGLLTGLLFLGFELPLSPYVFSGAGGLLTFAFTFMKGRQLARKEMEGGL